MRHISIKISLEPFYSRQCWKIPSYDNTDINEDGSVKLVSDFSKDICNYGLIPLDIIAKDGKTRITYRNMMNMYFWMWDYIMLLSKRKCHACINNNINECETLMLMYKDALEYYENEVYNKSELSRKYYADLVEKYHEYEKYIGGFRIEKDDKGKKIYYDFDKWVKGEHGISNKEHSNCLDIPLLLLSSIDDIGEYSIFYNEWEEGKKYKDNDIVFYDNRIFKKKPLNNTEALDTYYGSFYSKKYKESYFAKKDVLIEEDREWFDKSEGNLEPNPNNANSDQWEDITNKYFTVDNSSDSEKDNYDYSKNNKLFNNTNYHYVVKDGKIFFNPTNNVEDKDNFVGDKYEIISNGNLGMYYINNTFYNVFSHQYITYNSVKYLVYKFEATNIDIRYCIIDGIKRYSEYVDNTMKIKIGNGKYYDIKDKGYFISINDNPIYISDDDEENYITIKNGNVINQYPKIYGYSNVRNSIYKIYNNNIVDIVQTTSENKSEYIIEENFETILGNNIGKNPPLDKKGYYIDSTKNILYVFTPKTIYSEEGIITGYTDSKLLSLYSEPLASDNVGNQLPCPFNKDAEGNVIQPYGDGDNEYDNEYYLGFSVKKGNVSHLTSINKDIEGANLFWGNIITNISFYFLDEEKNKKYERIVENSTDNIINIINNDMLKAHKDDDNINKTLYCDITYYIGAIIKLSDETYSYEKNGVKCIDTVALSTETEKFYINKYRMVLVNYFKFNYPRTVTRFNEYDNCEVVINQCKFEINTLDGEYENGEYKNPYRDICEDMISAPIFREEYKFGSSSLEKVEGDIYIDRGISSSFEKHLKLLEINSLESLEQYGNGYYKIIKN